MKFKSLNRAIVAIAMTLIGFLPSMAYDWKVDGIYYNIISEKDKTVEVTYKDTNLNSYSGDIVIPTTITYASSTYTVESIGDYAFGDCTGLTSIEIPNSVSNIGAYAFATCTNLKSIKIGTGVIFIGREAFAPCGLTDIYIYDLSAWMNIEYDLDASPLIYAHNLYLNDELLTDVQIPEGTTTVSDYAFWSLECIESVTIPSTVKKISLDAFGDCPNLTTVTFNAENCTEMEPWMESYNYSVFSRCSTLSTLNIGEGVKHIPDYAFSGCENLKDILTLPASLESIGQYAFYGTSYTICKSLATTPPALDEKSLGNIKYLYVPLESVSLYEQAEGWKDIEYIIPLEGSLSLDVTNNIDGKLEFVISDKTSYPAIIQELIIHGTLNSEDFKFIRENMPFLSKLDISDTDLKELPDNALWNCKELTSVEIPNLVTSIGNSAFSGCTGLTSVEIPNSVTTIGNSAFKGCTGLTSVEIPNLVTSIGNSAFSGCTGLTSVEIPNSVTTIGDSAFSGCTRLTSVIWNPTTIMGFDTDSAPFRFCPVNEFIFGENVKNIPSYLCSTMTNLTSVEIPNSVTTIGDSSFENCSALNSLIIGESVSNISKTAFSGCSKLSDVEWNTITYKDFLSISTNPLNGCPISSFTFGNSVEYIPAYLCAEMTKLKEVKIPDSVTAIGDYVFSDCTELSNITLGKSVVSLGDYIFKNCTNLTTIVWNSTKCEKVKKTKTPFSGISHQITSFTFGNSVEFIPAYLCQGMAKVTDFKIPDTVKSIGRFAFDQCSGITYIKIPNLIETIEESVFGDCSKATILKMGANVKKIEKNAFLGCDNLKKIESLAVIPPTVENEDQFSEEVYQKCILYVPTDSKDDYKFSYAWSEFYNIEEKDFSNGVSIANIGNNNNLRISSANNGRILISGANDEDMVQVYTIGGILMAESNVLNIQNAVFNKGIYIVVINGKIHKLVL